MDADQWKQIEAMFHAASLLEGPTREAYLDEIRASHAELAREVASLLASHEESEDFLERPAFAGTFSATDEAAPAGTIGPYEIVRRLGTGGMGAVFEARQQAPRRRVALKVMRGGAFLGERGSRLFQREIEALGRLNHPSIAAIYDAGQTPDGQQYLAMELVEGRTLDEAVREMPAAQRARLQLFCEISSGVHYAHQKGVIHRDLKPSNVIVTSRGAKILDFGLARILGEDVSLSATRSGLIQGTLPYMSPEQARGDVDEIDTRTDIYSLGVILYKMLTGRLPYSVDDMPLPAAVRVINEQAPTPPSAVSRGIRGDLETIVLKCLEKDPDRRYSSAEELGRDIGRFLEGSPVEAKRDSGLYVLRRTLGRHKGLVGTVIGFVGLAGASSVALGILYREQKAATEEAEEQRVVAEERFQHIHHLAKWFIFDFYKMVWALEGSTPAMEALAAKSTEYLDRLNRDDPGDPAILNDLAAAYSRVGDVLGGYSMSNLGDTEGAKEAYRKSLQLFERLADEHPQDLQHSVDVLTLCMKLGNAFWETGERDESVHQFERALRIGQIIHAEDPSNGTFARALASSLIKVAGVHQQLGQLDEAESRFQRAVEIFEGLHSEDSSSPQRKSDLAVAEMKAGLISVRRGAADASLPHYERALQLQDDVLEEDPHNAQVRRLRAACLNLLGEAHLQRNDAVRSRDYYERAVAIQRELMRADPRNATARTDVASSLSGLAEAHLRGEAVGPALAHLQEVVEIREGLLEADPNNTSLLRSLVGTHAELARAHRLQTALQGPPKEPRSTSLDRAKAHLEEARRMLSVLREKNALLPGDEEALKEIDAEIARAATAASE